MTVSEKVCSLAMAVGARLIEQRASSRQFLIARGEIDGKAGIEEPFYRADVLLLVPAAACGPGVTSPEAYRQVFKKVIRSVI